MRGSMQPGAIERSPNHRRKEQAGMIIPVEQHEYLDWCQVIHELCTAWYQCIERLLSADIVSKQKKASINDWY